MFKEGDKVRLIDSDVLGEIYYVMSEDMVVVLTEDGYKIETSAYNVCERLSLADYLSSNIGHGLKSPDKEQKPAQKLKPTKKELEFDLHADKIFPSTRGISQNELLLFQLDEVRNILRRNRGCTTPIVLIHGHGDGKLRTAILKVIKSEFKEWSVEDAPFSKYGYQGAVKLRKK